MGEIKELIKPTKIEYGEDETVDAFSEGDRRRRRWRVRVRKPRWSDEDVQDDVLF